MTEQSQEPHRYHDERRVTMEQLLQAFDKAIEAKSYMDGISLTKGFKLSDEELDVLEHLMSAPDRDLFKWISGEDPTPANYQSDVLAQIQKFHGV